MSFASDFIVLVTGLHNSVATVAPFSIHPVHGATSKLLASTEEPDVQSCLQSVNIALAGLSTSASQPSLINNFEHLVLPRDSNRAKTVSLLRQFQDDLIALSKEIDKKNAVRRFPTNAFNPRVMTSSAGV